MTARFLNKTFLLAFGFPAAVFSVLVLGGIVLLNDLGVRAQAIEDMRRAIATRSGAIDALAALRADSERARIYGTVLENVLPTRDQLINFPKEFELIARKHNVRLSASFGGETPSAEGAPASIEFFFQANGSYADIAAFLLSAETSRYSLRWESFEFLKGKGSEYQAVIAGRVFAK